MILTHKQLAQAYHTAVSEHDVATVAAMTREDYIQHNPRVPTGRAAFLALFPFLKKHNTKIQNIRIFQDGSHVIMHHLWKNAVPFGADAKVAFHIIRFDHAGLIAEHWSVMTDIAAFNPSGRSLIDGQTEIEDLSDTDKNKEKVVELFGLLTKATTEEFEKIFPEFFLPAYHQHNSDVADGIKDLSEAIQSGRLELNYSRQHKVFGSGNFILSICEGTHRKECTAFYDLFRFDKGMIAEHWSVYQEIPTSGLANDNTMFNF
ncbi:MAG TPA: nuclear transport factor 2 family protein [Bacteriovoracaceae bacterium]|nr:nuclear transport factor 2 family protein [Bacteriovoracaceae bacterium]